MKVALRGLASWPADLQAAGALFNAPVFTGNDWQRVCKMAGAGLLAPVAGSVVTVDLTNKQLELDLLHDVDDVLYARWCYGAVVLVCGGPS